MLIFLDTNILYKDFHMKNNNFELIQKLGTIVLGEIIIDETCKKYRECLEEEYKELKTRERKISGLLNEPFICPVIDIESEVNKYRDFLEMYSIYSGMTCAEEYPTISHKKVVERALKGKKPFKPDGKNGYRDYIVWLTCLGLVKTYTCEEIHFITDNVTDFSADNKEHKHELHNDLLSDLDECGIDRQRLHYWININDFVTEYIKPRLTDVENEKELINAIENNDEYSIKIQNFITNHIIGFQLSNSDVLTLGYNSILKDFEFWDSEINEISKIDDESYLIEIQVKGFCEIEYTIAFENYLELEKTQEPDDYLYDIELIEKYDNGTCLIKSFQSLYVHLNGKYNTLCNTIDNIQLDYIEDTYCDFGC